MIHSEKKNQKISSTNLFKYIDITEIFASAFIKIMKKSKNEVIAMWFQDFEQLFHFQPSSPFEKIDFIMNVSTIIANDYEKFFNKMRKKFLNIKKLKMRIFKAYYK